MDQWLVYAVIGIILLFIFAIYLFVRRTVLGFKEGIEHGRDN